MMIKDLSQAYANGMPHAATIPAPSFQRVKSVQADGINVTQLSVATHVGTHIDAPLHVIEQGTSIDNIPLDLLIGPALAISIEKGAEEAITATDLAGAGSDVIPGDALLLRSGWGAMFGTEAYYKHPYLTEDAAHWLVERRVRLVGIDFITPELPGHLRPAHFNFPIHHILLRNNVLVIEHLFLEEVVGTRFQLFVGALKISGADGAPARVLAVCDEPSH